MNIGAGVQFGAEGPMMTGTLVNPQTGHKFTVRDCFFQDNQFMVQITDGQMLDHNTIQNYVQCVDADSKAIEPDTTMAPKSGTLPPEVAALVGEDMMLPEDAQATKGLGNLNNPRHIAPANEHTIATQGYMQVIEPIDQDLAMVDRVLRRHAIPDFEANLVWDCPVKQIETLIEVLGIDPETIAKYYIDKLNKDAIFEGIKFKLAGYIREQWGPKITTSAKTTETDKAPAEPKPRKQTRPQPSQNHVNQKQRKNNYGGTVFNR